MQVKDIPDSPILRHLTKYNSPHQRCGRFCNPEGHWCLRFLDENPSRIFWAFPEKGRTPEKLILAKMRSLIKKGLVEGCCCGCRGDFEITDKGKQAIDSMRTRLEGEP